MDQKTSSVLWFATLDGAAVKGNAVRFGGCLH